MAHIKFLDETMRDGQQSLWGMQMQAGIGRRWLSSSESSISSLQRLRKKPASSTQSYADCSNSRKQRGRGSQKRLHALISK